MISINAMNRDLCPLSVVELYISRITSGVVHDDSLPIMRGGHKQVIAGVMRIYKSHIWTAFDSTGTIIVYFI